MRELRVRSRSYENEDDQFKTPRGSVPRRSCMTRIQVTCFSIQASGFSVVRLCDVKLGRRAANPKRRVSLEICDANEAALNADSAGGKPQRR